MFQRIRMSEKLLSSLKELPNNNNSELDFVFVGDLHGGGFKLRAINCYEVNDNLLNSWKKKAQQHGYYVKLKIEEHTVTLICRETPSKNIAIYISSILIMVLLFKFLYYRNV